MSIMSVIVGILNVLILNISILPLKKLKYILKNFNKLREFLKKKLQINFACLYFNLRGIDFMV